MRRTHRQAVGEGLHALALGSAGAAVLLMFQGRTLISVGVLVASFVADVVAGRVKPDPVVLPAGTRIVRAAEVPEGAAITSARQLRDGSVFDLEPRDGGWPTVLSVECGENEPGAWYVEFKLSSGELPWLEPDDLMTVVPARQPASV